MSDEIAGYAVARVYPDLPGRPGFTALDSHVSLTLNAAHEAVANYRESHPNADWRIYELREVTDE